MKIRLLLMLLLTCMLGCFFAQSSLAAIYKYVDKDGLVNFADDLQSVPEAYRATAKIVSGEAPEIPRSTEPRQAQTSAPAATPAVEHAKGQPTAAAPETGSFGKRAFISAVVLVSAVFAFIILGILDTDHKKALSVVRVTILWGVSIYLLYAHAGDVTQLFMATGSKIEEAQKNAEEKGKKAAKAVKALNTLVEQAGQSSANPEGADTEKKE